MEKASPNAGKRSGADKNPSKEELKFTHTIGIPRESFDGEKRVALVPANVQRLVQKGYTVLVEKEAGVLADLYDKDYANAGAVIADTPQEVFAADIVMKVRPPTLAEVDWMKPKAVLMSFIYPSKNSVNQDPCITDLIEALHKQQVTTVGMDCIPRTTLAQSFDALSATASILGYRSVIEGTSHFGRFLSRESTASARVNPATVLVIGCGPAGLQAVATARKLGAVVTAFDLRPEQDWAPSTQVKEQVEAFNATFLTLDIGGFKTQGGYVKESPDSLLRRERELLAHECKTKDIVITCCLLAGGFPPKVLSKEAVDNMKPGSVVVDIQAEQGGNCDLTEPGKVAYTDNNVAIVGYTDLPSRMPMHSSIMYSGAIFKFVQYIFKTPQPELIVDLADDTVNSVILTYGDLKRPKPWTVWDKAAVCDKCNNTCGLVEVPGDVVAQCSLCEQRVQHTVWGCSGCGFYACRPLPCKKAPKAKIPQADLDVEASKARKVTKLATLVAGGAGFASLGLVGAYASPTFFVPVSTFGLSMIIGYFVVTNVKHHLHAAFMSVTNAVSGAVIIGGMNLMGGSLIPHTVVGGLGAAAVLLAAINLFGGFNVTQRLLHMLLNLDTKKDDSSWLDWLWAIPSAGFAAACVAASLMGNLGLVPYGFLLASVMCVCGMGMFSSTASAMFGTTLAMFGMGIGTLSGLIVMKFSPLVLAQAGIIIAAGGLGGMVISNRVTVQELPEMVAAFHSSVGLAAMLVSWGNFLGEWYLATGSHVAMAALAKTMCFMGVMLGGLTFTGSVVAFLKLKKILSSEALALPGRDLWNALMALTTAGCLGLFVAPGATAAVGLYSLAVASAMSLLLGWHVTDSIGGADMPVVITLLNSYSGWALVAEGFMINNYMLLVVGCLIGSSGARLTKILCDAMNRNLLSVIFGGWGSKKVIKSKAGEDRLPDPNITSTTEVADWLASANQVIIVPGYGMACAKAHFKAGELAAALTAKGVNVRFAIHAVAGRMPGQMNVFLGEANVPYEMQREHDDLEGEYNKADVCLVLGANDIVNSRAVFDEDSDVYGMPVCPVWEAEAVVVVKRNLDGVGYNNLDNPLFSFPNCHMLLGDAKSMCEGLLEHVSDAGIDISKKVLAEDASGAPEVSASSPPAKRHSIDIERDQLGRRT
eukprot:gene2751-552_t